MNQKRINWIDVAKALAIFLVVLGHTMVQGKLQEYIYSFHIPLFFFISGSLYKNHNEKFTTFITKQFKKLIIPYLAFGLISIVIYYFFGSLAAKVLNKEIASFAIIPNILGLLYGSSKTGYMMYNRPLWFIPCLFMTNLFFYLLDKLSKYFKKYSSFLLTVIGSSLAISLLINSVLSLPPLPWGADTAITMLIFFTLGKLAASNDFFTIKNKYTNITVTVLCLLIGIYLGLKNGKVSYSEDIYNNYFLFYLTSIINIYGYIQISRLINKQKILEYVGSNTLVILLLHKFPILFFTTVIILDVNNPLIAILLDILTITLCLIAGVIIEKIYPPLLGKKNKKSQLNA